MSSRIQLDVSGSKITSIGPQLLSTLDSKQRHIKLDGLSTNPIYCDCNARWLAGWLQSKSQGNTLYNDLSNVHCSAPDQLAGKSLVEINKAELTCDGTSTTTIEVTYSTSRTTATESEVDIIWEPEPTTRRSEPQASVPQPSPQPKQSSGLTNMDSVIICIVRLRLADNQYRGGPLAGPLALRAQGKCTR